MSHIREPWHPGHLGRWERRKKRRGHWRRHPPQRPTPWLSLTGYCAGGVPCVKPGEVHFFDAFAIAHLLDQAQTRNCATNDDTGQEGSTPPDMEAGDNLHCAIDDRDIESECPTGFPAFWLARD